MSRANSTEFVDFYELLGVKPTAELHEIRRAFIVKAKEHHPDAGGSPEIMRQFNSAYRTLKDSSAKAAYDMLHSFHVGSTSHSDYRYGEGRQVNDVNDMTDQEIDSFLDTLLAEYRDGPPKAKPSFKHWLKKFM